MYTYSSAQLDAANPTDNRRPGVLKTLRKPTLESLPYNSFLTFHFRYYRLSSAQLVKAVLRPWLMFGLCIPQRSLAGVNKSSQLSSLSRRCMRTRLAGENLKVLVPVPDPDPSGSLSSSHLSKDERTGRTALVPEPSGLANRVKSDLPIALRFVFV